MLGLKSKKFERQFHGGLKEFEITVAEPVDAFRAVLTFIYKEEVDRLPAVDTNTQDFFWLWKLANQYEIDSLEHYLVNVRFIILVSIENILVTTY